MAEPKAKRWNEYATQRLLSLASQGKGVPAIAREMGFSEAVIKLQSKLRHVEIHAYKSPLNAARKQNRKTRECLHCHKDFDSFGAGNRICPNCRSTVNSDSSSFEALYLTY